MPIWFKDLLSIFTIKPLQGFWILIASWAACWVIAMGALSMLRTGTWVYKCRRAWAVSFLIHAACVGAYFAYWTLGNRMIISFATYATLYGLLLTIDLGAAWFLYASASRFESYRRI